MSSPFSPLDQYSDNIQPGLPSTPIVVAARNPSNSIDTNYASGVLWLSDISQGGSGNLYVQEGTSAGIPTWTALSAGSAGGINTISDGSTQVSPLGGNIALVSTPNEVTVTSSAPAHELIFSIPTVFIAPGSIASTTTMTVGSNLTVTGDATIGDDLSVTDDVTIGGDLTVTGTINFSGLTVDGTVAINTSGTGTTTVGNATAGAITVDVGTGDFQVNGGGNEIHIGDDAAANIVVLGSSNSTASTHIQAGTGDLLLDGATTAEIILGSVTQTGQITIGRSTAGEDISIGDGINVGAQTISIGNGASGANSTVNILSGAGTAGAGVLALGNNARVTTIGIGNVAPAAARVTTIAGGNQAQNDTVSVLNGNPSANTQTFNVLSGAASGGTQALNLGNVVGGTLTIAIGNGINTSAQTINIANGASAANTTLNIMSGAGSAGAGVIAFGSNARVTTIGIANVAPAAARTITIQGGNPAQNDTLSIMNGNPSANTQTFNLMSGAPSGGTQALNIGNAVGGSLTIAMGNGINKTAKTINIANGASGANSTVNILSGAGTAGAGVLALGNNVRVTTIGIGNAAPDAARTITIAGGNQAQNDTVAILNGNPSANTQTFNLMSGTATGGTQAVNLGNGVGGALTVSIGNGVNTTAQTVNIANGASAANTTLNIMSGVGTSGAGVIAFGSNTRVTTLGICNIAPAAARTVTICGGNQAQNDTINIFGGNPSAGTQTFSVLNGIPSGGTQAVNIVGDNNTRAATVKISTGAAAHSTIIGTTNTTSSVAIKAGTGNITLTGNVLKDTAPAFLSYLAATVNNKTGAGTSYTIGTDALTEVFDRGSNASTAGVFTAPVTGLYWLKGQVSLTGCTIATTFTINIVATSRTATYTFIKAAGAQDETVAVDSLFDMTATDTAHVSIVVSGEGGDTVDILGGASLLTYFTGYLVA